MPQKSHKNRCAELSYVFGVLFFLTKQDVIGIVAFVYGCLGLKYQIKHPEAKNKDQLWIGFVLGLLGIIFFGSEIYYLFIRRQ